MEQSNRRESVAADVRTTTEGRSAWRAVVVPNWAGFARDYYASIPRAIKQTLAWGRYRVLGLNVAMRELGDLRAADAPESDARRYVGTLDRYVDALYAVPVRGEDALAVHETALDGREDVAECELRLALRSDDRVRTLNALDATITADAECSAIYAERCARRMRMRDELLAATGGR